MTHLARDSLIIIQRLHGVTTHISYYSFYVSRHMPNAGIDNFRFLYLPNILQ